MEQEAKMKQLKKTTELHSQSSKALLESEMRKILSFAVFLNETSKLSSVSNLSQNNLSASANSSQKTNEKSIESLKSARILDIGQDYLKREGYDLCSKVGMVYNVEIRKKGEEKPYYLTADLKNKPGSLVVGKSQAADATICLTDEVLADILDKKLNPATAILQRKLTFKGKLSAILKFKPDLIKSRSKL